MNSLSNSFKLLGIALLLIFTQYFSEQAESYPLVRRICMININKEIKDAGIENSQELALNTCKCFSQEIRAGESINNAKEVCKNKLKKSTDKI